MSAVNQDVKRATRNFSALVIGSVFSKGLLFAWQIVLGNAFLPAEYGTYNTVVSLMAVSAILINWSMGLIVVREGARQPHRLPHYWATTLFLQTLFFVPAYLVMMSLGYASGYSEIILAYAGLAGLSMWVDSFGNIGYDLLIAREKMHLTSLIEIISIVLKIGLAGIALGIGWGLVGVYGATILAGFVRSVVLSWANWRDGLRPQFPLDRPLTRELLVNSLPLMLAAFLSLAYQNADKLMTTAILDEERTGFLGPAFVINFGIVEVISTTLLVAIYPLLSRYYADEALRPTFGSITQTLARFMLMVSLPLVLALSLFAEPIILTLYNPNYLPTAGILSVLVWYTLIMMVGNVFSKGLLVQNRQRATLLIRFISLCINVALNAFFLFRFQDPRGTAVASVIAEAVATTAMMLTFRTEGFDWRGFGVGVGRILMSGGVGAITMLLLGQLHFVVGIIGGGLVYGGALLLFRALTPADWALLLRLAQSLPSAGVVARFLPTSKAK